MARKKSPTVIDGLTSIRAVRHAADTGHLKDFKNSTSASGEPSAGKSAAGNQKAPIAAHARRTSMPTKHSMLCYECGYEFAMHGALRNVVCPKCHIALCSGDIKISADGWDKDVRTVTSVTIQKGVTVNSCNITARNIIVAGDAEKVSMHIGNDLVLEPGAVIDFEKIEFKNLVIKQNMEIKLNKELVCNNIDISGTVDAVIKASGLVTVRNGGLLAGKLIAEHFAVEDGGGVIADLKVCR